MSDPIDQEIRILRAIFWSERDPEGRAFVPLADAYLRKGSPEEALSLLEDGLARHPDFASAHLVAARVQRALGRVEGVEAALASVLALDPGNAPGLRMKGELAEGQGDRDGALAAFREALQRDPRYEDLEGRIQRIEAGLPLEPFSLGAQPGGDDAAEESPDPEAPEPVAGLESTEVAGAGDEALQDLLLDSPLDAWEGDGREARQDPGSRGGMGAAPVQAPTGDPFLPGDGPPAAEGEEEEALDDFFLEDIRPAGAAPGDDETEVPGAPPGEPGDPSALQGALQGGLEDDAPAGEAGFPAEDDLSFEPGVFGEPAPDPDPGADLGEEPDSDLGAEPGADPGPDLAAGLGRDEGGAMDPGVADDDLLPTADDPLEGLLPDSGYETASPEDAEPALEGSPGSEEDSLGAPLDGLDFGLDDFPPDDPDVGVFLTDEDGEARESSLDDGEVAEEAANEDANGKVGGEPLVEEEEGEASELASDLASLSFEPTVTPDSVDDRAPAEDRIGDDLAAHEALAAGISDSPPAEEPDGLPLTRTLGELYARQGLTDEALHVFRRLAERFPGDEGLAARLQELEEGAAEASPSAVSPAESEGPAPDPVAPEEASEDDITPEEAAPAEVMQEGGDLDAWTLDDAIPAEEVVEEVVEAALDGAAPDETDLVEVDLDEVGLEEVAMEGAVDQESAADAASADEAGPAEALPDETTPPLEVQDDDTSDPLPARLARRPVGDYFHDLMTWASGAVSIDDLAPGAPGAAPGAVSIDALAPGAEGPPPPGVPSPLQPAPPPPDPILPAGQGDAGEAGEASAAPGASTSVGPVPSDPAPGLPDQVPLPSAPSESGVEADPDEAPPVGAPTATPAPAPPLPPGTPPAAPPEAPPASAGSVDPARGATPPRSPGRAPAEEAFEGLDDFQDWLRSLNR